jgi:hypothetical protein
MLSGCGMCRVVSCRVVSSGYDEARRVLPMSSFVAVHVLA